MIVKEKVIAEFKEYLNEVNKLPGGTPQLERNRAMLALNATIGFLERNKIPAECMAYFLVL